ncbi:hypothetical protein K8I85_13670, partial [bacterium]|nr:hypothetical protein [bacterium]
METGFPREATERRSTSPQAGAAVQALTGSSAFPEMFRAAEADQSGPPRTDRSPGSSRAADPAPGRRADTKQRPESVERPKAPHRAHRDS